MAKVAADFEKIINADRSRKKNEALAAKIFGRDRRASAPIGVANAGGSLASRAGVKKQRVSSYASTARAGAASASGIDGEWTHDLHGAHASSPSGSPAPPRNNKRGGGRGASSSLASRISVPGAIPQSNRVQRRAAQVAQALIKTELHPSSASPSASSSSLLSAAGGNRGLSIRGLAGPFAVMAQNFAPGTTAADIESAMTPVGGLVLSCRLLKTQPIVIAEVVFESREGADRVIATFNNQTADGRLLHVYPRVGGPSAASLSALPPRAAAPQSSSLVVDGSLGFEEPMEMDDGGGEEASRPANGRLYSDAMIPSQPQNQSQNQNRNQNQGRRGGRGFFPRGGGGRGGRAGSGR